MLRMPVQINLCTINHDPGYHDIQFPPNEMNTSAKSANKIYNINDDVIKWKYIPHYWPFCAGNSTVSGEFP